MLYGESKPYNVALVVMENYSDTDEAYQLIRNEIDIFSKDFPKYEKIKNFAIIKDEWTIENRLITATLKLRRQLIVEKYKSVLNSLY